MNNCEKCGSEDILTRYVKEGELISSSSYEKIDNAFIRCSEYNIFYQLKAKKEHLNKHCRNCQYGWLEDVTDKTA